MTKPKTTRTAAQEEARRNAWAAGAPTSAVSDSATSTPALQLAHPTRICNASMRGGDYRTGYGEVRQPVRQGAMAAYGLHSVGLAT